MGAAKKIFQAVAKTGVLVASLGGVVYYMQNKVKKEENYTKRYKRYYELTNQWLLNKNANKSVEEYFRKNQYKSIAVYGQGTLCELLCTELREQAKSGVKIEYFIDKNTAGVCYNENDIPTVGPADIGTQKKVDVIVVTPIANYEEIIADLSDAAVDCDIISLEDVIYEI